MNPPNPEATVPPSVAEQAVGGTAGSAANLRCELDKWRGRAARLLAALRERNAEVERLERELEAIGTRDPAAEAAPADRPNPNDFPGALAREAVIDELERELATLREAQASLEGDLHARTLTIGGLKRDLQGWKDKWHELARRLDGAATAGASEHARIAELTTANGRLTQELAVVRRIVNDLAEERDALAARNANLFETTGYANRQMEMLADDLAELRGQLKSLRARHDEQLTELDAERQQRSALQRSVEESRGETVALEQLLQSLQAASMALGADLSAADRVAAERLASLVAERDSLADRLAAGAARAAQLESSLVVAEQARTAAELARTEAEGVRLQAEADCRDAEAAGAAAERARASAEAARDLAEQAARQAIERVEPLSQQVEASLARQQQLEHQLQERSALVLGLEQELIERDQRLELLVAERSDLEADRARAIRNAREQADYVQQLDGRLDRQKELLQNLEQELSAAQQREAESVRRHAVEMATRDAEVRALQLQIAALQAMLQERPDAGASPAEPIAADRAAPEAVDPVRAERDLRTLRVLHQQLKEARTRNDTLQERVRELETRALVGNDGQSGDDLTRIRGVGPRLAQHLRELGVDTYQQIAELDPQALGDPSHALAALRSRILRDGWIEQAASLHRH